jgi:hypothetical protein
MNNNAIIKLLKTFSNKEMKEFREFLESPFFNKRKAVVKLFEVLNQAHPEFEAEILSKEIVFSKLFPDKKFNDSTLRVLTHYLYELTEKYLAYSRFGKEKFEYAFHLNKELLERNQYKLSEKKCLIAINYWKKLIWMPRIIFIINTDLKLRRWTIL